MPTLETVYYQDGSVTVTNARAVIDSKTYAVANITSVSTSVIPANRTPGIVIAVLGFGGAMCSYIGGSEIIGGVIVLGFGILLAYIAKDKYAVKIGSASGVSQALISDDRERIQKISNSINEAIIKRG